jgi:hypothetical protein
MKGSVIAIATVLALGSEDTGPITPRVYGGTPADDDLPQIVQIDGRCTGVLVGPQIVLYAAHCGLVDGTHLEILGDDYVVRNCSAADTPDQSALAQGRDFAACRLDRAPPVRPIPMLSFGFRNVVDVGTPVQIAGYGEDEDGVTGRKLVAHTEIHEVTDAYFVAGGDGVDTCRGDSGGPGLIEVDGQTSVAGVLSYGFRCGDGGYYGHAWLARPWLEDEFGPDSLAQLRPPSGSCTVHPHAPSFDVRLAFFLLMAPLLARRRGERSSARSRADAGKLLSLTRTE